MFSLRRVLPVLVLVVVHTIVMVPLLSLAAPGRRPRINRSRRVKRSTWSGTFGLPIGLLSRGLIGGLTSIWRRCPNTAMSNRG